MISGIFINVLAIVGVYAASREGYLLSWLRKLIEQAPILNKMQKPLINCPLCMSSFWGLLYLASLYYCKPLLYLFHILAVAGVIHLLTKLTSLITQATTYLDLKKLIEDDNDN
jgi:hypothetical protein